jgi:ABC-type transporter Mla subunit MlaD
VRVGGFRVGIVDKIRTRFRQTPPDGKLRAVAVLDLKLDKTVEPIATDSEILVRPRSALGLKYVEIIPGKSQDNFSPGATIPLENAGNPVEFDDLLNTFDESTRAYQQEALTGFGDAFTGRGQDLNEAIASFSPFFDALTPVMDSLNDPRTGLKDFFKEIGETSAEVRPVAGLQGELFGLMADTFDAITRDPDAFRATIERSPETMDAAIRSFPVQRSFVTQFAELSRRLRPTGRILPRALPRLNDAMRVGTTVLPQTVDLNQEVGDTFDALKDLVDEPTTLLALQDLDTTTAVVAPLLEYAAPYQTVCSYGNYFFAGLGGHISEGTSLGTSERVLLKDDHLNTGQSNKWSTFPNPRPSDVPSDVDPSSAYDTSNPAPEEDRALQAAHTQPFAPAIDAKGNADCQIGNSGYIDGPLPATGRYPPAPSSPDFDEERAGGSHVVAEADTPGLAGPTFNGVPSLKDVP